MRSMPKYQSSSLGEMWLLEASNRVAEMRRSMKGRQTDTLLVDEDHESRKSLRCEERSDGNSSWAWDN